MTKKCIGCGITFNSHHKNQQYCSAQCSRKHVQSQNLDKYKKAFADKFNEIYADRFEYVSGYARANDMFLCKCLKCGEIKQANGQCVRKGHTILECKKCASEETKARQLIREEQKRVEREQKRTERKRIREEEKARLKAIKIASIYTKICKECGDTFTTANKQTLYCSRACINKKNNRYKTIHRDKKLQSNGKIEYSISLTKLIKRDKGICALCGEEIDLNDYDMRDNVFIANDRYPSIDHIIPVSKGGTHTWDNIQLAHRKCNSIKHNTCDYEIKRIGQLTMAL